MAGDQRADHPGCGPSGHVGQIVFWEMHEGPFVSGHPSWGAWLARFRDGLKRGEFGVDANGRIDPKQL